MNKNLTKLIESDDNLFDDINATFYQDHGDLYYYNGDDLVMLPNKLKNKIFRKYYATQREIDANNDPTYDPNDTSDYRNRLKQVKASFKNRQNLQNKLTNSKLSDINKGERKQNQKVVKSADKFKLNNFHSYDELENTLNVFLADAQKNYDIRTKFSGTGRTLDPKMATEVNYYEDNSKKIPSIFLYFDRSYSWNDAKKTRLGYDIVSILNDYDERGIIDMKLFYFGSDVTTNEEEAGRSTNESVENLINHIKTYTPDNVIIITDEDSCEDYMSNENVSVTVPGTVWLISVLSPGYYVGAKGLARHINGGENGKDTYEFTFRI